MTDEYEDYAGNEPGQKTTRGRKPYVKNADLYEELVKWRDSADTDDARVASEKLGEMLMLIARNYMNHPNYVRYPQHIKDDIVSSSVCEMLKSLRCYKFEYKNPFAYFTQICWSCAMDYLTKYYKYLNFKRDELKKYIAGQIDDGVNVRGFSNYIRMLNDLVPEDGNADGVVTDNQEFIDKMMSSVGVRGNLGQTDDDENGGV